MGSIDPLPASDFPIIGWTYQEEYLDANGTSIGNGSGVRYMAQIDSMVVSANVVGPMVDFNFDVAYLLLQQQAACAVQDTPCEPVSLEEVAREWPYLLNRLFFDVGNGEADLARWIFPVEEPIRMPEQTSTLNGISDVEESSQTTSTDTAGENKRTRTSRSAQTGGTEVTRTSRTATSGETEKEVTRTSRTASTGAAGVRDTTNATVVMPEGTVWAEQDTRGESVEELPQGTRITITGEPVNDGTTLWYPVLTSSGNEGWMRDMQIQLDD